MTSIGEKEVVRVVGLTKRFPATRGGGSARETVAVDSVTLSMAQGEVFGLVGPNGAGKTTLIKMMTTLLTPTEGRATIAGLDTVENEQEVRKLVGLVTSNERSFYWRLTGRQNLEFFAALYGLKPEVVRPWIDELLEFTRLSRKADDRFDRYSTGMRQRLAIARGLLSKPQFVFMDEPTKGVDPTAANEIVELIRDEVVMRWAPTILITSHNLTEVERLCRRIALVDEGKLVALGTLSELQRKAFPTDQFRLRITGLPTEKITGIASEAGAVGDIETTVVEEVVSLAASFARETGGLAKVIRGVVGAGGDVVGCSERQTTLDDVFHHYVNGKRSAEGSGVGG